MCLRVECVLMILSDEHSQFLQPGCQRYGSFLSYQAREKRLHGKPLKIKNFPKFVFFVLEHYTISNNAYSTPIQCSTSRKPDYSKNEFCKVDVETENFKDCTAKDGYGFAHDTPCIFVKLNRVRSRKIREYLHNSGARKLESIPMQIRDVLC